MFVENEGLDLLCGLGYASGSDAIGADADPFPLAAHQGPHSLQIRFPAPPRLVVCVADAVSVRRFLAANFALLCHNRSRELESSELSHYATKDFRAALGVCCLCPPERKSIVITLGEPETPIPLITQFTRLLPRSRNSKENPSTIQDSTPVQCNLEIIDLSYIGT